MPGFRPSLRLPVMRSILIVDAAEDDPAAVAASGTDGLALSGNADDLRRFVPGLPAGPPPVRLVGLRIPPVTEPPPDLGPLVTAAPQGLVVSGFSGPADLVRLSAMLAAYEAIAGMKDSGLGIVAVLDNPAAFLDAAGYREAAPARLAGLGWDADALAVTLGAAVVRRSDGTLVAPLAAARSLCLMAAAAAGLPAYDTACSSSDINVLRAETDSAREAGFAGKFARRSDLAAINSLFDPNRSRHR